MKNLTLLILTILLTVSCTDNKGTETSGQTKKENWDSLTIDSLKDALRGLEARIASIESLNTGDMIETSDTGGVYGHSFRVEIRQSEIYRSLYVSQVDYFGESHARISKINKIDIEKEFGINSEGTSTLQFKQWQTPTDFEVTVGKRTFELQILDIQNIKVTEK